MKVVFLNFYGGHVPRGIETFVHELANRLSAHHQVTVCQCGPALPKAVYQTEVVDLAVDWSRLNELRHLSTLLFFDFSFQNLWRRFYLDYWSRRQKDFAQASLKKIAPDTAVVISVGSGWISLLSRLWCWRHGAKLVIAGQSGPGWDDRINLLCRPDAFVALTTYQARWARRNAFGAKVVSIPNGVDLKKFNSQVKPVEINLPRPLFLCVAALEPGKHVDTTIRAVAGLKKGSLLVLGEGPLKESLTKLAAELLPGRFRVLSVPHNQIPAYYAAGDVVTMVPPLTESFGIVFLEAMAMGLPVVTTNDPPRKEIVGKAGLFTDLFDVRQYTAVLKKALKINWGSLPRQQAEKFSWDKIAAQYDRLFRSL
ncbi:glycosyltransferase family 4 protein [Candidatus Microgenomates bacterium]|nr:glycosyltransferase family 4 protein [Candidatus Microgenomates bacterium]